MPAALSDSSSNSIFDSPSLDLWISTLLPSSSSNSLSATTDAFPSIISLFSMSGESSVVPATSVDVTLPSSSLVPSLGHIEFPHLATLESIVKSTTPIVQSAPSLPNTHPMLTRSKHGIFKPKAYAVVRNYFQEEPPTFNVASRFPHWVEAMDSKYASLLKQNTWFLVPLLASKNVVHCKSVYKIKRGSEGTVARYKARLMAKGFL